MPAPTTHICGVRPLDSILLIMLGCSDCVDELGLCALLDRSLAFLDIENRAPVITDGCKLYVCAG